MVKKKDDSVIAPDELIYRLKHNEPLPKETNILVICGEEDYYRSQIIKAVPDYFFADMPASDREITTFDKNTDLTELNLAINTYPFFSGRSLIILSDEKLWAVRKQKSDKEDEVADVNEEEAVSKKLEQLTVLLQDIPEYCTVVINAKKLDKRTKFFKQLKQTALICTCDKIKDYNLPMWLNAQAAKYNARFVDDALATLSEYIEPVKDDIPLGLLQQEIEKLAVYAGERKQWTGADILNIFASLPNASTFAISNSIGSGKLKESLEILAIERKKGTSLVPIMGMVAFKLRQIARYLELKNKGYDYKIIMDEMSIKNSYAMNKVAQQARSFDERRVREALLAVDQLNIDIRRGGRDYARLEEILINLFA